MLCSINLLSLLLGQTILQLQTSFPSKPFKKQLRTYKERKSRRNHHIYKEKKSIIFQVRWYTCDVPIQVSFFKSFFHSPMPLCSQTTSSFGCTIISICHKQFYNLKNIVNSLLEYASHLTGCSAISYRKKTSPILSFRLWQLFLYPISIATYFIVQIKW